MSVTIPFSIPLTQPRRKKSRRRPPRSADKTDPEFVLQPPKFPPANVPTLHNIPLAQRLNNDRIAHSHLESIEGKPRIVLPPPVAIPHFSVAPAASPKRRISKTTPLSRPPAKVLDLQPRPKVSDPQRRPKISDPQRRPRTRSSWPPGNRPIHASQAQQRVADVTDDSDSDHAALVSEQQDDGYLFIAPRKGVSEVMAETAGGANSTASESDGGFLPLPVKRKRPIMPVVAVLRRYQYQQSTSPPSSDPHTLFVPPGLKHRPSPPPRSPLPPPARTREIKQSNPPPLSDSDPDHNLEASPRLRRSRRFDRQAYNRSGSISDSDENNPPRVSKRLIRNDRQTPWNRTTNIPRGNEGERQKQKPSIAPAASALKRRHAVDIHPSRKKPCVSPSSKGNAAAFAFSSTRSPTSTPSRKGIQTPANRAIKEKTTPHRDKRSTPKKPGGLHRLSEDPLKTSSTKDISRKRIVKYANLPIASPIRKSWPKKGERHKNSNEQGRRKPQPYTFVKRGEDIRAKIMRALDDSGSAPSPQSMEKDILRESARLSQKRATHAADGKSVLTTPRKRRINSITRKMVALHPKINHEEHLSSSGTDPASQSTDNTRDVLSRPIPRRKSLVARRTAKMLDKVREALDLPERRPSTRKTPHEISSDVEIVEEHIVRQSTDKNKMQRRQSRDHRNILVKETGAYQLNPIKTSPNRTPQKKTVSGIGGRKLSGPVPLHRQDILSSSLSKDKNSKRMRMQRLSDNRTANESSKESATNANRSFGKQKSRTSKRGVTSTKSPSKSRGQIDVINLDDDVPILQKTSNLPRRTDPNFSGSEDPKTPERNWRRVSCANTGNRIARNGLNSDPGECPNHFFEAFGDSPRKPGESPQKKLTADIIQLSDDVFAAGTSASVAVEKSSILIEDLDKKPSNDTHDLHSTPVVDLSASNGGLEYPLLRKNKKKSAKHQKPIHSGEDVLNQMDKPLENSTLNGVEAEREKKVDRTTLCSIF